MSGFSVDPVTLQAQRRASDPQASAWVSANAGSGKTHVLAQRVKRLLVSGVAPEKILCLTFTKAAASNMANRILSDLAAWVRLDERELRRVIAQLDGRSEAKVTAKELKRARQLFARALETPGGLKIQTIHAFCDALLHQFSFEAGLAGKFQILDDAQNEFLVASAFERVLREAEEDSAVRDALLALLGDHRPQSLRDMLFHKLDALRPLLAAENLQERIAEAAGLSAQADERAFEALILNGALPPESWVGVIQTLENGGASDQKQAEKLKTALQKKDLARALAYLDLYLAKTGEFLKEGSLASKKIREANPQLCDKLAREWARLRPIHEQFLLYQAAKKTLSFLAVARAVSRHVERQKAARGLVSYGDLILRAGELLNREGAAWVRYKLDPGIDHILIDEAQDTSEAQWHVLHGLTQEFFAGEGARPVTRTFFAVGDDKQSIFSFQGAEPRLFDEERKRVRHMSLEASKRFEDVTLNLSFRSSSTILESVDRVFLQSLASAGVTATANFPPHQAAKRHLPGRIEIWPLERKGVQRDIEGFDHPFDEDRDEEQPRLRLARRVAEDIGKALRREPVQDGDATRLMRASDVLVLVRTRGQLFEALLREMKRLGLPVAGADRLVLTEHIAAQDLIALGDAMLLPDDDLTYATVLKSPLIRFDDDDLFALCHSRERPLHQVLKERAGERPHWQMAQAKLENWRTRALCCRPYEFYARVLSEDNGRRDFYRRLGSEAGEVLDELLNTALAFETARTPTLQNFLGLLRASDSEIKREMQQGQDEIRVMTVHNAKGLEAKWVILADTVDMPGAQQLDSLYPLSSQKGKSVIWAPPKSKRVGLLQKACDNLLEKQGAEYRRLLYVAMTRAEEKLTICGAEGKGETAEDCWYALVRNALQPVAREEAAANGETVRWVIGSSRGEEAGREAQVQAPSETEIPLWTTRRLQERAAQISIAPSHAAAENALAPRSEQERAARAKKRGVLLHRLLEHLPQVPFEKQRQAAQSFLQRMGQEFSQEQHEALIREAMMVIALPEMQALLRHASQGEVPIAADLVLPDGRRASVEGQIDRLVMAPDAIHIIDFKSGQAVYDGIYPEAYVSQLGLYREALKPKAAGKPIHCYLLWTEIPRLDEVLAVAMERSLLKVA